MMSTMHWSWSTAPTSWQGNHAIAVAILSLVAAAALSSELPSGWRRGEVGNAGVSKGSSSESAGVWSLNANGFVHVVYQTRADDFTFVVRLTGGSGGIRISSDLRGECQFARLDANVRDGASKPSLYSTFGDGAYGRSKSYDGETPYRIPVWLRVERYGMNIGVSTSQDGRDWYYWLSKRGGGSGASGCFYGPVVVGLYCDRGTATFDNVAFSAFDPFTRPCMNSWVGESFGGNYWFGTFQYGWNGMGALFVEPDGDSLLCNAGDAQDHCIIDRNGFLRYQMQPAGGWGPMVSDEKYLYYDTGNGVVKTVLAGPQNDHIVEGPFKKSGVRGLLALSGKLYVSTKADDTVHVLDRETFQETRSFRVERPHAMAGDREGNLWIVQYPEGKKPAAVAHYAPDGAKLSEEIGFAHIGREVYPGGIAVHPATGRVYVTDHGESSCIWIFESSGKPAGRLGDLFGLYSGRRGVRAESKLWFPRGVGFDAAGSMYVLEGYQWPFRNDAYGGPDATKGWQAGCLLRKFDSKGNQEWERYGLEWGSVGQPLADDEHTIHSPRYVYRMDYSKPPGQDVAFVGVNCDPARYPDDIRCRGTVNTCYSRTVRGAHLFYMLICPRAGFAIYRQDAGSDIMIPCGELVGGKLWIDSDGDGQKGANESLKSEAGGEHWHVDRDGGLWTAARERIQYFECRGLDARGTPLYDPEPTRSWRKPDDLATCSYVVYDAAADRVYLGGYTREKPRPVGTHPGHVGSLLLCFGSYVKGPPRKVWQVDPPFDPGLMDPTKSETQNGENPCAAMDEAGDYLFLGEKRSTNVHVLRKSDAVEVARITPGPETGCQPEWLDNQNSLLAYKRGNGEYLIFTEMVAEGRFNMYRWRPQPR